MDNVITFLASFLIWFMFAGLVVLWFIDGKIKKEIVKHALFASIAAWGLSQMFKSLIPMERPFISNGSLPLTITIPSGNAFPSSHTAIAFAIATTLWFHNKKLGIVFVTLALLVGVGRVLGNVHYPLDIAGGAVLGASAAFLLEKIHFPIDS